MTAKANQKKAGAARRKGKRTAAERKAEEAKKLAVIDKAAQLDAGTYGIRRTTLAAEAGMPVGFLDKAVKERHADTRKALAAAVEEELARNASESTNAAAPDPFALPTEEELTEERRKIDEASKRLADIKDDDVRERVMLRFCEAQKIPKKIMARAVHKERMCRDTKLPRMLENGSQVDIADHLTTELRKKHPDGGVPYTLGDFFEYVHVNKALAREEGRWVPIPVEDMHKLVHRYEGQRMLGGGSVSLSSGAVEGIIKESRMILAQRDFFDDAPVGVNCLDGFTRFDDTGEPHLLPHNHGNKQLHTLQAHWHEGASGEIPKTSMFWKLLNGSFLHDPDRAEKIGLLQLVFGAAIAGITTKLPNAKATIFYGPTANNGKSQLIEVLTGLFPESAVASVAPGDFGDQHKVIHIAGKRVNASDELSTAKAIASDKFKEAITGNRLSGRDLYRSLIVFKPVALHVFAANLLPVFVGGMDKGTRRRLLLIPFLRTIPEDEQEGNDFGQRIAVEEADIVLAWAVEGARRLVKAGRFPNPKWAQKALADWAATSDPVYAWCSRKIRFVDDDRRTISEPVAYASFKAWAVLQGFSSSHLPAHSQFMQRATAEVTASGIIVGENGFQRALLLDPDSPEERTALAEALCKLDQGTAAERTRVLAANKAHEPALTVVEGGRTERNKALRVFGHPEE